MHFLCFNSIACSAIGLHVKIGVWVGEVGVSGEHLYIKCVSCLAVDHGSTRNWSTVAIGSSFADDECFFPTMPKVVQEQTYFQALSTSLLPFSGYSLILTASYTAFVWLFNACNVSLF